MLSEKLAARMPRRVEVPDLVDWIAGLRLACAFLLPVAVGLIAGQPLTGLFVGIGGFMVANADLGESYGQRLRLMVPAAIAVAGLTAAGMLAGGTGMAAVPLGAVILLLGGLAAGLGREAAVLGTFLSFAYVIGVGLAATPDVSVPAVALPMLAGGAYAMVLSAINVAMRGHKPDEKPEPWRGLLKRARSRTDATLVRHAAALAIAGAVGLTVVPFTHQSNGAWLVTGALIVLKPGYPDTVRTALLRTAGTVAGAVAAGAIAAATSQRWVLLTMALILTCSAGAMIRHSFAWFAVLIAPLSILLTNVLVPGDWQIAIVRVADVAAGSLIAIAVATLLRQHSAADQRPGFSPDATPYGISRNDIGPAAGPSRTRKEVTAMTVTRRPRPGQLMALPRRAIRALRHVHAEFLRASEAIIRSARAPQPTGQDARSRAS